MFKKYYYKIKNENCNININLFMCENNKNGQYITKKRFFKTIEKFIKKTTEHYHTVVEPLKLEYNKFYTVINVYVNFNEKKSFNWLYLEQKKILKKIFFYTTIFNEIIQSKKEKNKTRVFI